MASLIRLSSSSERHSSVSYKSIFGTPLKKRIFAGVFTVFVIFTVFVCAYVFMKNRSTESKSKHFEFVPFFGIKLTADPCSNFYEFTCGKWPGDLSRNLSEDFDYSNSFNFLGNIVSEKRKDIFVETNPNDDFPRVVNDALKFYNYCTNVQNENLSDFDYLLEIFDKMGGWPILNLTDWEEHHFDWIQASAYLLKNLDTETVVGFHTVINNTNSSLNILYISLPQFNKEEHLLKNFFNKQILFTIIHTLNPDSDGEYIVAAMKEIQKAEESWRQLFSPDKSDPIKISLRDLQIRVPQFNWSEYIHLVMKDALIKYDLKITDDDVVMIDNLVLFERAFSTLQSNDSYSKKVLANLFGWFVVQDLFVLIPSVFTNYAEANGYDIYETTISARDCCFEKTLEIYEHSIDYLYVQNTSHVGVTDSKVLVHYIKSAFNSIFADSDWLDESTKSAAIRKLNSLQTVLGFKEYYTNKTTFSSVYNDFPTVSENVLETYFNIKEYFALQIINFLKYGNNIQHDPLPRSVTDVSAYYILQMNVLALPISMHSSPFYYRNGPWYLNFGALGTIIGHEIMHAFDKLGYQRNEKGNFENWWTNSSLNEYNTRYDCFKHQYTSYYNTDNVSEVVATLNENIADNVGLQLAYLAYKLWIKDNAHEKAYPFFEQYSADQMFFISFGSVWCSKPGAVVQSSKPIVHSSPELRVIGAISNSEFFSKAFGCPKGSSMNPDNKCFMW